MEMQQNESFYSNEDSNYYDSDLYNLDVWLDLFPELGLQTLKRIKTRLESGAYQLDNFIPEDVLRRRLDKHIDSLEDLVDEFKQQTLKKSKLTVSKKSLGNDENYCKSRKKKTIPVYTHITKCRHKKFIRKKEGPHINKVSRATSPYFSSELLENVLVEELVAESIAENTGCSETVTDTTYCSENFAEISVCSKCEPQDEHSDVLSQGKTNHNLNLTGQFFPTDVPANKTKDQILNTDDNDTWMVVESSSDSSEDSVKVQLSDATSEETRETVSTSDASAETVVVAGNMEVTNNSSMINCNTSPKLSRRIYCEHCNSILVDLRRQAIKIWMPFAANRKVVDKQKQCELLAELEASLCVPEKLKKSISFDQCQLCGTTVTYLKNQTLGMVHSLERTTQKALSSNNISSCTTSTDNLHQTHRNSAMAKGLGSSKDVSSKIPTVMGIKGGIVQLPRGGSANGSTQKQQKHVSNYHQHSRVIRQRARLGSPVHQQPTWHEQDTTQQHQNCYPSDLPPRKDSPFPQAIASEKHHRDRKTSHQQQQNRQNNSHAWLVHNQRLYNQMLNGNIPGNGNGRPSHTSYSSKVARNIKMESLTPQDYANMNGHHIDAATGLHYFNGHGPQHNVVDRPGMLQLQQQQQQYVGSPTHSTTHQHYHHHQHHNQQVTKGHSPLHQPHYGGGQNVLLSPGGSTSSTGSGTAAAVSFFTRAAQKLNISSKKRKKKDPPEPDPPPFPTNFRSVLQQNPPPVPPCLLRIAGSKLQNQSSGKVKVLLRICPLEGNHPGNYLNLDARKKQITVYDPTTYSGYTTPSLRRPVAPRLFEFDSVFSQDDALAELCCSGLVDIIQSVVNGSDGCIFSYGHARLGKTYTMIGVDEGSQNLGIIPCSISWLFKLIEMQKERTGARFSVRVSAVEVTGKNETLKDLLADVASAQDSCGREKSPGVYLREDPICGTQLENQSELWAPTADKAAYYLDAAVAARTIPEAEEDARNSHLLFTIHVYQYRVEKGARSGSTADGVAGGRSRLHLLDLGSCSKSSKDGHSLSLHALGMAILALLNGQKHVPHRESKLTQLIRESLGNMGCRTCMIAHVSPAIHAYNETLQVIQLAGKIHRTKRRRKLMSGTSSDDSSCDGESVRRRMRTGIRMGTLRELSHSDPDYTSSSEQSCDTVIYVGPYGNAFSDEGLTDNERPPTSIPVMPRNIAHKIQPRTVPTFSRSRSHSGDESGSDGDRSTVVSHNSSSSHGASSVICDHRMQSSSISGRVTPRMIPEPRMIPPSIAKPRIGPSPLTFQNGYSNSQTSHHHNPSLYGPAPLPGYYHTHGPESQQQGGQSEQWIDGPLMGPYASTNVTTTAMVHHEPNSNNTHEQWVDGPKPVVNPKALNEQWIDGPKEFLVGKKLSSTNNNNVKTVSSDFVDGASSTSKPSLLPKVASSSRIPSSSSSRSASVKTHRHCERKSELTQTVLNSSKSDSESTPVNKTDSSLTVGSSELLNNCDNKHEVSKSCNNCVASSNSTDQVPVKSFVKDWVEKHSGMSSEVLSDDQQHHHKSRSSKSCSKRSKLTLSNNSQASLDAMLYGKDKSVLKNSTNSPHSSPKSTPRVTKTGKDVTILPQVSDSSSNKRTLAWVKSVQDQNHSTSQENTQERNEILQNMDHIIADIDNKIHSENEGNYTRVEKVDFSPPPEYETLVFTSSKLENVEEVTEEESANESEDAGQTSLNKKDQLRNISCQNDILNSSFDSEPNPENEKTDENNLFMNNRESIYELQFDAELETSRSSIRNSFHSEDDAWSLGSIPKDLNSESYTELETKDVDNVQVPALDSTYASQTLDSCNTGYSQTQLSTLDSGNCTQLDNSFATTAESNNKITHDLDTSTTGISTMDSRAETTDNNSHFVIVTDKSELSPLTIDASEHEKVTENSVVSSSELKPPVRPSFLRRPDGASNPNLFAICETSKSSIVSSPGEETLYHVSSCISSPISPPYMTGDYHDYATIGDRSVIGQSPDKEGSENTGTENKKNLYKDLKSCKSSQSSPKPSVLPKPSSSKDSLNCLDSKPAVPPRTSSKLSSSHKEYARSSSLKGDHSSHSKSIQSNTESSSSQIPTSPFGRSLSAPVKSSTPITKSKDKHKSSSSPSPATRPSSIKPPKNSFASRLPLCSSKKSKEAAQSSPTKSSASSSGKESKSSKDSSKNSAKDSKSSLKDSSKYSSKDVKNSSNKSSKDSKSSAKSNKDSKSSTFGRSKSPSPSKRDRDSKLPLGKIGRSGSRSKGCESDSGIESGRIKSDHLLLSPAFSSKHRPRISMHSTSSGHGSDVSSTFSGPVSSSKYATPKESRVDVCNSSGYESMLRDSELTGTSSSHDSTSESGQSDRSSSKLPKKRSFSSKRSKSAPAYSSTTTPTSSHISSPCKKISSPAVGSSKFRPDTRWGTEPLEIKVYEIEDVERMARRRKEELELREVAHRRVKIRELLQEQENLKNDLQHAKSLLMVEPDSWSFDLYVAEQMDRDDPDFLEALEKETQILQKRVEACKSRIMMVTCFDNTITTAAALVSL